MGFLMEAKIIELVVAKTANIFERETLLMRCQSVIYWFCVLR